MPNMVIFIGPAIENALAKISAKCGVRYDAEAAVAVYRLFRKRAFEFPEDCARTRAAIAQRLKSLLTQDYAPNPI